MKIVFYICLKQYYCSYTILNANEDESEQADDETKEIVFKVPSISEVYLIKCVLLIR